MEVLPAPLCKFLIGKSGLTFDYLLGLLWRTAEEMRDGFGTSLSHGSDERYTQDPQRIASESKYYLRRHSAPTRLTKIKTRPNQVNQQLHP
jgi:hypothetical protein